MKEMQEILAAPSSTPWCPNGCEKIAELDFWDYPTMTVISYVPAAGGQILIYAERILETTHGELWVYCQISESERLALSSGGHTRPSAGAYPFSELPRLINGRSIVLAYQAADAKRALGTVIPDGRIITAIAADPAHLRYFVDVMNARLDAGEMTRLDFNLSHELFLGIEDSVEADIARAPATAELLEEQRVMWHEISEGRVHDVVVGRMELQVA